MRPTTTLSSDPACCKVNFQVEFTGKRVSKRTWRDPPLLVVVAIVFASHSRRDSTLTPSSTPKKGTRVSWTSKKKKKTSPPATTALFYRKRETKTLCGTSQSLALKHHRHGGKTMTTQHCLPPLSKAFVGSLKMRGRNSKLPPTRPARAVACQ